MLTSYVAEPLIVRRPPTNVVTLAGTATVRLVVAPAPVTATLFSFMRVPDTVTSERVALPPPAIWTVTDFPLASVYVYCWPEATTTVPLGALTVNVCATSAAALTLTLPDC